MLLTLCTTALAADLGLDLKLVDPLGNTLIDQRVDLPYNHEFPVTVGKQPYAVTVAAEQSGKKVALSMQVFLIDGETRVSLANPNLDLTQDSPMQRVATTAAPRKAKDAAGNKLALLNWTVSGSWTWTGPDWPAEARKSSVNAGDQIYAWEDAVLWEGKGEGAHAHLRPSAHTLGESEILPLVVVADEGDWVRARTQVSGACSAAPTSRLSWVELDVYVKKEDLLLVTKTPLEVKYSDGSWSKLRAGVPVAPAPNHHVADGQLLFRAATGSQVFDVALPAGSLALSSPASAELELAAADKDYVVPNPNKSVGNTTAGVVLFRGVAWARGRFEMEGGAGDGVVVGDVCAVHGLLVQDARVKPFPGEVPAPAPTPAPVGWVLPEGSTLTWPDGTPAGRTRTPVAVSAPPAPPPKKGKAPPAPAAPSCFDLALDANPAPTLPAGVTYEPDPEGTLKLCYDPKLAVQHK